MFNDQYAKMIDSHCHLADRKFTTDLSDVITRATLAGVSHIVTIADDLTEAERCRDIAQKYEHIFYTAGVHPHTASQWQMNNDQLSMEHFFQGPKCVAVGEIGLDYHYMNSPKEDQIRAFRDQIMIAKEIDKPIVVHNRESFEDLLPIIDELKPEKMVLHCCTEKWEDAKEIVDRGYLLGFTGIATYPKSQDIREVIKHCPLTQMMVETDAPYLAPEGKRGQRNEPAFVKDVALLIADIKGISFEEVDRVTTKNTVEFYQLAPVV